MLTGLFYLLLYPGVLFQDWSTPTVVQLSYGETLFSSAILLIKVAIIAVLCRKLVKKPMLAQKSFSLSLFIGAFSTLPLLAVNLLIPPLVSPGKELLIYQTEPFHPLYGLLILLFILSIAISEELFFRYFIFNFSSNALSVGSTILFSSLLFSFGHLYMGVAGWLGSLFSGVILMILYLSTGRITASITAHTLYNGVAFIWYYSEVGAF